MKYFIPVVFVAAAAIGVWLFFDTRLFPDERAEASPQTRIVTPKTDSRATKSESDVDADERLAFEDSSLAKISLDEGETAVAVITQDLDGDPQDEQLIAVRRDEMPITVAFIDYDESVGGYKRVWNGATGVTRPRTFSIFVKDLIGDRSLCIVATGMNDAGEQTMVVFRKRPSEKPESLFEEIAELRTDGSIVVGERDRSQAYQLGIATDASFKISIYGRDYESANLLDQIETIYDYNAAVNRYERIGVARIPGAQIEQRRVRQLLDGTPERFESFLDGLWTFVPSGESLDAPRQYVLFDKNRKEVIFYVEDTQEVFSWENSNATRYGIYVSAVNISVTTLRRLIDIELSSADSIRLKVFEDVKLKIGVGGRWDGTYRKIEPRSSQVMNENAKTPVRIEARYESDLGPLSFSIDGSYVFAQDTGMYAFFWLNDQEFLELRKADPNAKSVTRSVYGVTRSERIENGERFDRMRLTKVRLGIGGAENLHEGELEFRRLIETRPPARQ